MKYQLKDLQGAQCKENCPFDSKADIIKNLADFHNMDWTDERYPTIYDLLATLPTEQEKLDFLLEYGQFEIFEVSDVQAILTTAFNESETETQLKGIHKAINLLIKESQAPSFELIELRDTIIKLAK